MNTQKYYRANEIYSMPARNNRPARRGVLPIGATHFYNLLAEGKIPQPDAKIGDKRLWSDSLLRSAVKISTDASSQPGTPVE